jgi:hypothetical protein
MRKAILIVGAAAGAAAIGAGAYQSRRRRAMNDAAAPLDFPRADPALADTAPMWRRQVDRAKAAAGRVSSSRSSTQPTVE